MFNAPASRLTPRRTPLRPRESVAASSRAGSIFSESFAPPTPSARSSRLAISRVPASPTSSAGETVRTVREVDGFERVTWAKDGRFEVYSSGLVPKSVEVVLKKANLLDDVVSGHLDPISGYAFVTTPTSCIAWNYQKRTHSSPTTYTFPAPPSDPQASKLPVLASLFSSNNAAEPGMVLVSSTGDIWFWESMSLALANVDRHQSVQLQLNDYDYAEKIFRIDGQNFVITTTSALAFRVSITTSAGRIMPSVVPLTRAGGMFSRASATIFPKSDGEGIQSVASVDGAVYLLSGKVLQKWTFSSEGQKFISEHDLHNSFGRDFFEEDWEIDSPIVQLRDLVPCGTNKLAALVSYTEEQSTSYARSHSYAIHIFTTSASANSVQTSRIVPVTYSSHPDPRALDIPRLFVPASSPTAFIRFADSIVLVSLDGEEYEDVIALKDTAKNAFIGMGCNSTPVTAKRSTGPALVVMPRTGGLMAVDLLETPQHTFQPISATATLKSKMEQAVFFGDRSDNPLSFQLPPGFQGDTAAAAEAVSAEILASSSPYEPASFELRSLLLQRLARLKDLMAYIRANGLQGMLPQDSRRRLSRDAEKAKAAIELWDHQNHIMEHLHTKSPGSLLADSIETYMKQSGFMADDDFIRSFFRTQIPHLDKLLDIVYNTFRAATSSLSGRDISSWVKEVNHVIITVTRAATKWREDELATYDIDRERPTVEFWTARDSILSSLESLYETTEQTIKERTRTLGSTIDESAVDTRDASLNQQRKDQVTMKTQLADLAAVLCLNMEDKIRLHSQREMNGGADPNDGMNLKQRWDDLRPRVIRPLVAIDRVAEAYQLAEHHSDFSTLVWLCHEPRAQQGTAKVQSYIEKFKEDFAFVLYQYCIDQGQLHALMTQDEVYGDLLTKFFEINDYPDLAWMHHIACKRCGQAASALITVDARSSELGQKHLVSSIGKLAAVADIKSKADTTHSKKLLNAIDDGLELVGIQNDLREVIVATKQESIAAYVQSYATGLTSRPSFAALFARLAGQLIDGQALDLEELIDVLTLKDNRGSSVNDPATALDRLIRDTSLPEGRKQVALVSTWRRIFVRDDWNVVSNTAGRSDEAQREMLRGTLAYHTLKSITDDSRFPQSFIISPYDASTPPYASELSARFPDYPAADIEALMADHEAEIALLREYIDEAGLERLIKECAELVRRDTAEEAVGDDDVDM